jgi:hypothetical protein
MKKTLFAAATVVAIYVLFVVVLIGAENQGRMIGLLSDNGESNISTLASPETNLTADTNPFVSYRDPMPPPSRKPAPPDVN